MFLPSYFDKNHPNPSFYRKNYELLNGTWDFCLDYKNKGIEREYNKLIPITMKIKMPYSYLEKRSGIGITKRCDHVWYQKTVEVANLEDLTILHIEGADYITTIYVNGNEALTNEGAYHRISADLTPFLNIGKNRITIYCQDDMATDKPRGKQRFLKKNFLCWYEETTGIYKDVWIEHIPKKHIQDIKFTPSFKNKNVKVKIKVSHPTSNLSFKIMYKDEIVYEENGIFEDSLEIERTISLENNFHPWDVLNPEIYEVVCKFGVDEVNSYFGVRDITINGHYIYLNEKRLYQKLVLDQGYIYGGGLTLTNQELEKDIELSIKMGFNGARKHQKRESDIYYAYADFMGFIVWLEMPSFYKYNEQSKERMQKEWFTIIDELYNHPSIISYTPFNESWGIKGIEKKNDDVLSFVNSIYEKTKEFDPTRLCQTNDGWANAKSDFLTVHLYEQDKDKLKTLMENAVNNNKIPNLGGKKVSIYDDLDKPLLIDEFGGTQIQFRKNKKTWGYGKNVKDRFEYAERLKGLFDTIFENKRYQGYCFTQLSDVRQECNGIYTMDRTAKISEREMKEIQRSNDKKETD